MIGTKQAEAKKIDIAIEAEEELPKYLTGDAVSYTHLAVYKRQG